MKVTFKDDCTRVVKVMQKIFIVRSPYDKIEWHKKECANQLIRSTRLKRKKAETQTMNQKLKLNLQATAKCSPAEKCKTSAKAKASFVTTKSKCKVRIMMDVP